MSLLTFLQQLFAPPAADTTKLSTALADLQKLVPTTMKEMNMSEPTGMVQLLQSDLDTFAAKFEAVKTALAGYIATLVAGQAAPLPAAVETGVNQALADLSALVPPTPAP